MPVNPNKYPKNAILKPIITNVAKTAILQTIDAGLSEVLPFNGFIPTNDNLTTALLDGNNGVAQSLFGLPVWDVIQLRYDGQNPKLSVYLPICSVEVGIEKLITTTSVQGLNGTIKEYIADGDYTLSFKATLFDKNTAPDFYPESTVTDLLALFSIRGNIQVYSEILTNYFKLQNIVITKFSFSQTEKGMRNIQYCEFEALSDNPDLYNFFIITK